MRDLLLVVPSRGRPASIARLQSAMAWSCRADTVLLVGLDTDDDTLGQYPPGPEYEVHSGLHQEVAWINTLAVPRTGEYRAIGAIGDDNLPDTDGWDVRILEALEKTPFAFGNDLYPGRPPGTVPCHLFCRSETVAALGCMGPPVIRHMYVDAAWAAWGRAAGITYLDDVIIEHLHYTAGKAPVDASYTASTALIPVDLAAYQRYCLDPAGLNADIARLGARPFSHAEIAEFNASINIPATTAPDGWVPGQPLQ